MTEVKKCTFGNGLFATRNYKIGDYVCFYDGADTCASDLALDNYEYALLNPTNTSRVRLGYAVPRCADGVGQIANDYACLDMGKYANEKAVYSLSNMALNAACDEYIINSIKHRNIIIGANYKVYATQSIVAGDQLYVHYGLNYWITNYRHANNSILLIVYAAFKMNILSLHGGEVIQNGSIVNYDDLLSRFGATPNGSLVQNLGIGHLCIKDKVMAIISLIL